LIQEKYEFRFLVKKKNCKTQILIKTRSERSGKRHKKPNLADDT
jgi:hypothetical protein